jgi:hypothetical protein
MREVGRGDLGGSIARRRHKGRDAVRYMPGHIFCAALTSSFIMLGAPVTALPDIRIGSGAVSFSVIDGSAEQDLRSQFDRNALPVGSSDASFQNGQMFQLSGGDMPPLIIAPIGFDTTIHADGKNLRVDCGAFFLEAEGRRSFLRTTAAGSSVDCMGLMALGAMPNEGPRPRLLRLYDMEVPHDLSVRSRSEIDVLVWNETENKYDVDRPLSRWLTAKISHPTIANVRQLLATRSKQ